LEAKPHYSFLLYAAKFLGTLIGFPASAEGLLATERATRKAEDSRMRFLIKVSLAATTLAMVFAVAPAAKADPLTLTGTSSGFSLSGLGNDGTGDPAMDSLEGASFTNTRVINGAGSFVALLNPLSFTTGPTGPNSGGGHPFNFSETLTINGQTQTLDFLARIDIDHMMDTVHILSAAPLTFTFNTFSVLVEVIPTDLVGTNGAVTFGELNANVTVIPNAAAVPEPATLTLLGLGLAGTAAKLRRRRKRKAE
jgi:hypothetical protein